MTNNASPNKRSVSLPKPNTGRVKGKVRKAIPLLEEKIEELHKRSDEKLLFSFEHLDKGHEAFNLGGIETKWYISLFEALQEVSKISRNELVVEKYHHFQSHQHEWEKLDYIYNLDKSFLEQVECLQFRLSTGGGRVHGFVAGNRFYIVWLDPHHNLYPDKKHSGSKFYDQPMNSYLKLLCDYKNLESDNKGLEELLDKEMYNCVFCGRDKNLVPFKGREICGECFKNLKSKLMF